MIKKIIMKNYGPIKKLIWNNLSNINLIIGNNNTGKSFILKSLFLATKFIETGNNLDDIICNSFNLNSTKELINNKKEQLEFKIINHDDKEFFYNLNIKKKDIIYKNNIFQKNHSVLIPNNENISIIKNILLNKNNKNFYKTSNWKKDKIIFDKKNNKLLLRDKHKVININLISDGIKKIETLNILLKYNYIDNNSIIFIDNLEQFLHPQNIINFLKIINDISKLGVQIFISTHSLYVYKKLYLYSLKEDITIPTLSLHDNLCDIENIRNVKFNSLEDLYCLLYKEEMDILWNL